MTESTGKHKHQSGVGGPSDRNNNGVDDEKE